MNREKFQEIVHDIAGRKLISGYGKKAVWEDVTELELRWRTGGLEGGNCWDGQDRQYAVGGEAEPAFEDFDNLLEKVCPDLSYLRYKKLERLIEIGEERENEYYGNYSIHAVKTLSIDTLWDFLNEHGYGE